MKKRIWELDALRGICIWGMLAVHICFDLFLFGLWSPSEFVAESYLFLSEWGGIFFFLISGICVTLGSHPIRRGLIVFGCGMLCTLVTAGLYFAGLMGRFIIIYFGVLHCLGICMLLWPLCKKLPVWALALAGAALIALGFYLQGCRADTMWLMPLGIRPMHFSTSDYFPLFPNLGYFLMGSVLGRTIYKKKTTLIPCISEKNIIVRFFSACGRWSLPIYLLHQPVVYGLIFAWAAWR